MHDVSLMTVIDCGKNLLHNLSGLLFGETALIANFFEELSSSAKFCNDEEGSLLLIEFKDLDDIRVIKLLENLDFIHQSVLLLLTGL